MTSLSRLAGLALVLALLASAAHADVVRLRDGTLLHGRITAFDEGTGMTLERVDTGGVVVLRWEHLPPDEVKRIKASRGFTGEEAEPWMVEVVHLVMRNGTTETGVLETASDGGRYALRRRGAVDEFPRSSVRSVETGQVEGLEVYSPEELYLQIVESLGAPTDAARHLAVAVACEGAKLYDAARDHYLSVAELDARLKPELVASRLSQIEVKLEDAVETEALDEIRSTLYRKRFEQAREMAEVFRDTYPTSRQMGDLVTLETEIGKRKREHFGKRIVGDYFDELERRIDTLARDDDLDLDLARELAENAIHDELIDDLAEAYVMPRDTVQDLWDERRGGSVRTSSYADGTFILGKEKALEFGRFEEEDDDPEGAAAAELEEDFDDLVAKVKKQREALAQQKKSASRGAALEDHGPTPDEWWAAADTDARRKWIMAYYAEFSGQLKVIEAKARNCRRCDGSGRVDGTNEKGEPIELTCHVCKGLKRERVVRAR